MAPKLEKVLDFRGYVSCLSHVKSLRCLADCPSPWGCLCYAKHAYKFMQIAVGGELLNEIPVKGGAHRMLVQAKGGFIRGVGPAAGFNADLKPFSADYILVCERIGTL